MPIIEYECPIHGKFEELYLSHKKVKIKRKCPECKTVCNAIQSIPSKFKWGKSGGWN